jgi:hypothetical protein
MKARDVSAEEKLQRVVRHEIGFASSATSKTEDASDFSNRRKINNAAGRARRVDLLNVRSCLPVGTPMTTPQISGVAPLFA